MSSSSDNASKYLINNDLEVPEEVRVTWQSTMDLVAGILNVPSALIMRVHPHEIEVIIRSQTEGNVYEQGERVPLDSGLYCEHVMDTRRELLVPNALIDPVWDHNPDIELGMISYLGYPLTWPDGALFGTICVLDDKENSFSNQYKLLLREFRQSIQWSLKAIYERHRLDQILKQIDEAGDAKGAALPEDGEHLRSVTDSQIMVVDDNLSNLKFLIELLKTEGYQVRPASDPRMALESALDEPPELFLLDVMMPVMDGFELCQKLKQAERTAKIPVIFLSALCELDSRLRGFEVGGVDYITKPIQREEVLARVRTHLALRRMQTNLNELIEVRTRQVRLDQVRFAALYELSQMHGASETDLASFALEAAVSLTGGEVGYLHLVDEGREHIDLLLWSQGSIKKYPFDPGAQDPSSEAAVWADCISRQELIIENDGSAMMVEKVLSEGGFPLQRYLSLPIRHNGKIVAFIGVGNKKLPYNQDDARQLGLFGYSTWSIINGMRSANQLQESLVQTIQAISLTLEKRDPYTAGHQRRVSALATAMAEEMGLDKETVEGIKLAGLIHDIGKIHIPVEILSRPGRLSENEFNIIKTHPEVGYQIVRDVNFPWPVARFIHEHHERLDGSGYPQGLSGDKISFGARVLAVADVVEAMATFRPYRPALSIDTALEEIEQGSGTLYDHQVATACVKLFRERGYQIDPD